MSELWLAPWMVIFITLLNSFIDLRNMCDIKYTIDSSVMHFNFPHNGIREKKLGGAGAFKVPTVSSVKEF